MGRPDHPTIISEMILRGDQSNPPECWGDIVSVCFRVILPKFVQSIYVSLYRQKVIEKDGKIYLSLQGDFYIDISWA